MLVYRLRGTVPPERPDVGEVYRPSKPTRVVDLSDYFVDDDGNIHNIDYVYVVMPDRAVGFLTQVLGTLNDGDCIGKYLLIHRIREMKVVQYRYILAENNHKNYLDTIEIMVE